MKKNRRESGGRHQRVKSALVEHAFLFESQSESVVQDVVQKEQRPLIKKIIKKIGEAKWIQE